MIVFLGAKLGLTVDTVHASTLAFRSISHIFYDEADLNPDAFLLHSVCMEKSAQLTLLDAVLLRAVRTWTTGRFPRASRDWHL